MEKIIFFTLAFLAMAFVLYLGIRSTIKGFNAKSERTKSLAGGAGAPAEQPQQPAAADIGRAEKRLKSLWVEGASKRH